jgi:ABC-2 type transport system ATP-binding protein
MPDLLESSDPRGRNHPVEVQAAQPEAVPAAFGKTVPRPQARQAPALLFDRVSKWYGPVIGVNLVTLELRGGVTGLVGANGAGKSTLLRLAAGLLRPDIGRVDICGRDAWSAKAKRQIGYCPDTDSFYEDMSGRQFVETMARLEGYRLPDARLRAAQALELVGMADRARRQLRAYSKGMRQRVKLAQALVRDPAVLILDEPLSGVDPIGRQEILALLAELADQGKCLLVSSHELEELEKLTDHIAIMTRGRIAAVGTLAQIRGLLDQHPLTVRVCCDRPRDLAATLMAMDHVVSVEIGDNGAVIARVRNPQHFFRDLPRLVLEEQYEVRHLETLDDSAHAVLTYMLRGRQIS